MPYLGLKKAFWGELQLKLIDLERPWMLFGDLNEIIHESEKWGGRDFWRRKLFLKKAMDSMGGIDLGYFRQKYTWSNKQEGLALIKGRLDRAIASHDWLQFNLIQFSIYLWKNQITAL